MERLPRKTARAVIYQQGKLLVMERWRQTETGQVLHYFSVPGGGIEAGETPEQAVKRELMEEMTVKIEPTRFLFCDKTGDGFEHNYYWCRFVSGQPKLDPGSEEATQHAQSANRFVPRWVEANAINADTLHYVYAPLARYLPYLIKTNGHMPRQVGYNGR